MSHPIISCFLLMKPESPAKAPVVSTPEEYLAVGVPAEWVEPLQKSGYTTIDKLKEVEKPGKLVQHLKLKQWIKNPTAEF